MEWLNLHLSVMDSTEFVGSDQIERGTWLCLMRFCAGQENGGLIVACRTWKDRQWQQQVRVTLREVTRANPKLWEWQGDDLQVFFYPLEQEQKLRAKRDVARENGKAGGRPKKNPHETEEKPSLVIFEKAERKGKKSNASPLPPHGGGTALSDEDLFDRINSLNTAWAQVPAMTRRENRHFRHNRAALAAITVEDWRIMAAYLKASIPDGCPRFQPQSRAQFLDSPTDVLTHALQWHRKREGRQPPKPPAQPVNNEPVPSEEIRGMLSLTPAKP